MKNIEYLKIDFGGKETIKVETLTDCLNATSEIISVIAKETLEKDSVYEISIIDVGRGSFDVVIAFVIDVIPVILDNLANVLTIFTSIMCLKKFLKGKRPSKIEDKEKNKVITNTSGEEHIINRDAFNIYANNNIDTNISHICATLSADDDRTYLNIESQNTKNVIIEKVCYNEEDLLIASNPIEFVKNEKTTETKFVSWASIRRPCLSGDMLWELIIYNLNLGKSVKVSIEDKTFLEDVISGAKSFSANTRIEAKFSKQITTDDKGIIIGNPKYVLYEYMNMKEVENLSQISFEEV